MAEVGKPVNFRRIDGTCLYRSSRPEGPATSHVFKSAGIKTILDLRDASEVCTSQGCDDYQLVSLKQPSKPNQELVLKPAASKNTRNSGVYAGRHVMAQFLRHSKIPADEPPWIKVILLVLYLIDRLIGTQMARNLTIKWVLHKEGDQALCWLYRHFVDHHGRNICAGQCSLYLLSTRPPSLTYFSPGVLMSHTLDTSCRFPVTGARPADNTTR